MTARYLINLAAVADLARVLIPAASAAAKEAPTLDAYDPHSRLISCLEGTLAAALFILANAEATARRRDSPARPTGKSPPKLPMSSSPLITRHSSLPPP